MKFILIFMGLLLLPVWAEPLSLEQVREAVEQHSHKLKVQSSKVRQSGYSIDEAYSMASPQIQLNAGTSYLTPTVSFATPQANLPITEHFNYNIGLQFRQAIHTFGRLKWSTMAAKLAAESADYELEQQRQSVMATATQAYLDVLFSDRAVLVTEQQQQTRELHLEEARLKRKAGVIPPFEVLGFETAIAQAEQSVISARQQSKMARTRLLLLMGREPHEELELEAIELPEAPTESVLISVERALSLRPGLKALAKATEAAHSKVHLEQSQNNPQLAFQTSYIRQNSTAFQPDHMWTAGLQLSVPLSDGGLTKSRVSRAQEDILQLRENLAEAQRNITLEVEQLHSELLTSWARRHVAERGKIQADEFLRLAQLRYKVGVSTNLELLQAETSQAEASLAVHRANYQILKSYFAWRNATGLELATPEREE